MKEKNENLRQTQPALLSVAVAWLVVIILAGQFAAVRMAGAQCTNCSREASFDQLFEEAAQKGSVMIIVRLNIARLQELTAASNAYSVMQPGRSFPQSGKDADLALKAAIDGVADAVVNTLKGTAFTVTRQFSTLPLIAMRVSPDALAVLETLPQVANCVPDRPVRLEPPIEGLSTRSKPEDFTWEKGVLDLNKPLLNDTTGIIGAEDAWAMGYTGSGWYVAVLDSGILNTHEFFAGKTIVEKCYSLRSNCPNGTDEDVGPGSAAHYSSIYQSYDHGTHVAGIATGNNGTLFGVAKDADIIAVQVFSRFTPTECCGDPDGTPCVMSYTSDQLKGLEYVYGLRSTYSIASVNMSLGGGEYSDFCDDAQVERKAAIDNLRAVGIATVIATGNDGYCGAVSAPACISSAISVGASYDNDTEAPFNNWHPVLQRFFAPGVSIYSSTADTNTSYEYWNGTSMATPHVAGAWAILRQADPAASVTDIYDDLVATGTPVSTACTTGGSVPRINIDSAIYCDPAVLLIDALLPESAAGLKPGVQATLKARASNDCNRYVYGVAVEVIFSNGDSPIQLYDDGLHSDGAAYDGIFGNWWIPINEQDPTTITYTATKTGYTSGMDQVDVTVVAEYCDAGGTDAADVYISNVTFAGIDNDSIEVSGYSDYTSGTAASVSPGTDEVLSVTISTMGYQFLTVFIDWNHNFSFNDAGERYDLASSTSLPGPYTTTISVPADAAPGDTRMRVVLNFMAGAESCGIFKFGEVEDYTVSVVCDPNILMVDALSPDDAANVASGVATLLQADVADQCGDPVSGVTVEATFSNGDSAVPLYDDGLHDDGVADDGLFADWWTPVTEQDPTTITFTASNTGYTSGTDQVDVAVVSDYCAAGGLDSASDYITNLTFAGIDNNSTQAGGYADYTAGIPANVVSGTNLNLWVTISPDTNDYLSVFIDWNQDMVFDDPDERYDLAGPTDQPGPFTSLISVPADAVLGDTCLRVVMTRDTVSLPCGSFDYGEVEDYTVNVACNTGLLTVEALSPAPAAVLALGSQTILQARVSGQCGALTGGAAVETTFSNGDSPIQLYDDGLHDDGVADDGIFGNWWMPVNQQDPTTITYTASATGYPPSTDRVDVTVGTEYCSAAGAESTISYISNVTFAGIDNDSTQEGGYSDFTAGTPATVTPGTDEILSVTIFPRIFENVSVFIDWNQNAVFDDPGESYVIVADAGGVAGPFTVLIPVPVDAPAGDTRMRVIMTLIFSPVPCGTFIYGEVEDYTVHVNPLTASLDLFAGWNLISLPLSPLDGAIETVLNPIAGKYISVWSFSAGAWKLYDPASPGFSDLFEMDAGIGYWINMTEAATLDLTGVTPPGFIPVSNGWNLVGYNSSSIQDPATTMASIAGQYVSVWAYINNVWLMYDPANPGFSDLPTMEPGFGYWINATSSCTWTM